MLIYLLRRSALLVLSLAVAMVVIFVLLQRHLVRGRWASAHVQCHEPYAGYRSPC